MPGLTVVIATRDRRSELLHTLDRLTALPERPPIIVVDNGSTDGSVDAARRQHPAVTVLALDNNAGAAARTIGVRRAQTPYVAFSDDDSWWAPGSLSRAEQHLEAHPSLGLLAARILVGPDERLDPVSAGMATAPLGRREGLPGPAVLGFLACGAVVRRDAFLAVGGFAELLFFGGEEQLLAWDLAAAGWELAYVDDVVAHHHPSTLRHHPPPARQALQDRNQLLTTWLRRPAEVVTEHTLALIRGAVTDPVARAALAGAIRRLPAALRGRRALPLPVERAVRTLEQGAADEQPVADEQGAVRAN